MLELVRRAFVPGVAFRHLGQIRRTWSSNGLRRSNAMKHFVEMLTLAPDWTRAIRMQNRTSVGTKTNADLVIFVLGRRGWDPSFHASLIGINVVLDVNSGDFGARPEGSALHVGPDRVHAQRDARHCWIVVRLFVRSRRENYDPRQSYEAIPSAAWD